MEVQIHAEGRCWVVKGYKLCRLLNFWFSASKPPFFVLHYFAETRTWQSTFLLFFLGRGAWRGGKLVPVWVLQIGALEGD